MPTRQYICQVSFGSNTSPFMTITADTFAEAGTIAVSLYDANTAVPHPSGNTQGANPLGHQYSVANNNTSVTVSVRDPQGRGVYTFRAFGRIVNTAPQVVYTCFANNATFVPSLN